MLWLISPRQLCGEILFEFWPSLYFQWTLVHILSLLSSWSFGFLHTLPSFSRTKMTHVLANSLLWQNIMMIGKIWLTGSRSRAVRAVFPPRPLRAVSQSRDGSSRGVYCPSRWSHTQPSSSRWLRTTLFVIGMITYTTTLVIGMITLAWDKVEKV